MRAAAVIVASAWFLVVAMTTARVAHADAGASDVKAIAYSYEIENPDLSPDKVIVVWPRNCGSYGDPLGKVDLALNPDWASRQHDVDYEVVVKAKKHELLEQCTDHARFYALPVSAFPLGTREATADDSAIGQQAGAPFAIVPALDEIALEKRIDFLAKDPRVLRASFRFDVPRTARSTSALKAIHDVLAVDGFGATAFSVVPKRAVYTYLDGSTETLAYLGAHRRASVKAGLLDDAGANANASASASANANANADAGAGAGAKAEENAAPKSDLGTRWVVLAAVGGLIAGGLIARNRKKAQRK